MKSGIYQILNLITGYSYVGSSKNISKRMAVHRRLLRSRCHKNQYLQNAWSKYGEENFEFRIVMVADISHLCNAEQYWMEYLGAEYNICFIAYRTTGLTPWNKGLKLKPMSSETKRKISKALMGHEVGEATRAGVSKALSKIPKSTEHRSKLRLALLGRSPSREAIENSASLNRGVPHKSITCPYCLKTGGKVAMLRWHFEKCKFRPA